MKRSFFATFFLVGPLLASASALDLTPHASATSYNGLRVNRYFFEDTDKQMGFRIDNKMTVNGTSASVAFKFEDIAKASMQILKSPKKPEDVLFEDKDIESYRTRARALLPGNATDIQLDQENPGAIAINGWASHQFVFVYKVAGVAYRRSVTFLNYSKTERLMMDISAPATEFDSIYLRGYQVLNSLSERRAGDSGST